MTPTDLVERIPLTRGLYAIVDSVDLEAVSIYRWRAQVSRTKAYAETGQRRRNDCIKMHWLVAERAYGVRPAGLFVDHKNGDGLDNRRSNLRYATLADNVRNKKVPPGGLGFRGVCLVKTPGHGNKIYRATLRVNNRRVSLGYYATPEEAAAAYDRGARHHFGEFAGCNFEVEK